MLKFVLYDAVMIANCPAISIDGSIAFESNAIDTFRPVHLSTVSKAIKRKLPNKKLPDEKLPTSLRRSPCQVYTLA